MASSIHIIGNGAIRNLEYLKVKKES